MINSLYLSRPQFLARHPSDVKFHKLMFLKKNGVATSEDNSINFSRDYYDTELICVSNETDKYWIGNFAEGFGFFNIHFAKEDCREATDEEVCEWIENPEWVKF